MIGVFHERGDILCSKRNFAQIDNACGKTRERFYKALHFNNNFFRRVMYQRVFISLAF